MSKGNWNKFSRECLKIFKTFSKTIDSQAHLRRIKMELEKQLKDYDYKLIYEYPKVSLISYENIINNNELRNLAVNQIKKMITLIQKGNIDDEEI